MSVKEGLEKAGAAMAALEDLAVFIKGVQELKKADALKLDESPPNLQASTAKAMSHVRAVESTFAAAYGREQLVA